MLFATGDTVSAYAWMQLAAERDPIQAMTSGRHVIRKYLTVEEQAEANALLGTLRQSVPRQ